MVLDPEIQELIKDLEEKEILKAANSTRHFYFSGAWCNKNLRGEHPDYFLTFKTQLEAIEWYLTWKMKN